MAGGHPTDANRTSLLTPPQSCAFYLPREKDQATLG
jgi:hypothetical protein